MTGQDQWTAVGQLPETEVSRPRAPVVLTRLVWLLFAGSLAALGLRLATGWGPELPGVAVDGLTVLMWTVVSFLSGIVHSYSRRYMAGERGEAAFFRRVFGFTLAVMVLVVADHVVLFLAAWLAMGLVMARLIAHGGWPQARAAGRVALRYFLASSALLAGALGALWWTTGAATVSGMVATAGSLPKVVWLAAAGALVLAAMVQSALVPFHGWLLGSMTAPTPASALMHAGFVNAGGILLVRFAPVVSIDARVLLAVAVLGAASALLGKLLKSVQPDIKRQLGCSTVGQMGFMILQAGLGFFGAAVTHLVLHGFYKAYQFLASGAAVEHTSPGAEAEPGRAGPLGLLATGVTALAGGALFAVLTGKGTSLDSGLLLTVLVVLTTLHAARGAVRRADLPTAVRYGAVPLVFLPAIALYAGVYEAVTALLAGLPLVTAPAALTPVHVLLTGAFLLAYVAIESGAYQHSDRLYAALVAATEPPANTLLIATEEYREQ